MQDATEWKQLLDQIPFDAIETSATSVFTTDGWLLSSRECFRIVIFRLVLDIDRSDVISVEEMPISGEARRSLGTFVRVSLRVPFRVHAIACADPYLQLMSSQRAYPIVARSQPAILTHAPRYEAMEREFLEKNGLL